MDLPGVEPAHPQHRFCLPIGCSGLPPSVYTHLISELSAYCVGLRQAHAFASPRFLAAPAGIEPVGFPRNILLQASDSITRVASAETLQCRCHLERNQPSPRASLQPCLRLSVQVPKDFFSSGGRTRTGGLVVMSHASYQLLYPASGSGTALS